MGRQEQEKKQRKIDGARAIIAGTRGEEIIKSALPELVHTNRPGADFMTRDGKTLFEVKTTLPSSRQQKEIRLKALNGKWTNQIADIVLIVTGTHIYFGSAAALRGFVTAHCGELRPHREKHKGSVRVLFIPINKLVQSRVVQGIKRRDITKENFNLDIVLGRNPKGRVAGTARKLSKLRALAALQKSVAPRGPQLRRSALPMKPATRNWGRKILVRQTFPR